MYIMITTCDLVDMEYASDKYVFKNEKLRAYFVYKIRVLQVGIRAVV